MNAFIDWYVRLPVSLASVIWLIGIVLGLIALCRYAPAILGSKADRACEREKSRESRAIKKRDRAKAKLLRSLRITAKRLNADSEPWSPNATRAFMRCYRVGADAKRVGS